MGQAIDFFIKRLLFVYLVCCIRLNVANSDSHQHNLTSLNFEQFTNDIFLQKHANFSKAMSVDCFNEIQAIKRSLQRSQLWSLKRKFRFVCKLSFLHSRWSHKPWLMYLVLDSWGKFPSAIFSGNLYEFGGFSQCFDIKRDGKHYETQYCLGQVILERTTTIINESLLFTVLETSRP